MIKKHKKHSTIKRPGYGTYHQNEWAILGTPCGNIKTIAFDLIQALKDHYQIAYVDADHPDKNNPASNLPETGTALAAGANFELTDKINYKRFDTLQTLEPFQNRILFNHLDLVLVNGNHFKAKKQIVVIDERKLESLSRKLDRLTDVNLFLFETEKQELPDFVKSHLPNHATIPRLYSNQKTEIATALKREMESKLAPVNGLVLVGGKSQRMGRDKGMLEYHGMPQREFMAQLLNSACKEVFISCRAEQLPETKLPILKDSFLNLGPYGAILSAFREEPEKAWLVVACDLPLLNQATINELMRKRNPSKFATAFYNPATAFPEPLITIWEPKAYPVLLQFLSQGYSCPRKVLINSDIEVIELENAEVLMNVNHPEEYEEVMTKLRQQP